MAPSPRTATRIALATPPGEGGIHVLFLLGPGAWRSVTALFRGRGPLPPPHSGPWLRLGTLEEEGRVIDEALLACLPRDGEALFEINLHGGPAVARAALAAFERAGARPASWPRFLAVLRRTSPFDRLQARAHASLARARSAPVLSLLAAQVGGNLSEALARALTLLDRGDAGAFLAAAEPILRRRPLARALTSPPVVGLAGPPNAGKSTLFNALLGLDRALVSDAPGTTRDVVRETALFCGIPVLLCDTAGLAEEPADALEREGVGRARALAGQADAVIRLWAADVPGARAPAEAPETEVAVLSKVDLAEGPRPGLLPVSARTGSGLPDLRRAVVRALGIDLPVTRDPLPFPETLARDLEGLCRAVRHGERADEARTRLARWIGPEI